MNRNFKIFSLFLAMALLPIKSVTQSAPIAIDGLFEDWTINLPSVVDPIESKSGIDLLDFTVTNDADWLYINIHANREFDLSDDLVDHSISLHLDTDNNSANGAELDVNFSQREVSFDGNTNLRFNDISMRSMPTVTSNRFEIAIDRNTRPNGSKSLFAEDSVTIYFYNGDNKDRLPNVGDRFTYSFDETAVTPKTPVDIDKEDSKHVRIVAYNTLFDGLKNPTRVSHFEQILKNLKPDIIGFSECNSVTSLEVKKLLNSWLPLGNPAGWYVEKHSSHGLITASKWAISDRWQSLERQFPVLVDLPETYKSDLLFTNAHLKCCNGELQRQNQADSYISFIQDAKTSGGEIDLPEGTPFVYAGDLNLVGYAQQLNTLLTGDIQNTTTYGSGGAPDWDNTNVTDLTSYQTEDRMTFTWKSESSDFPAGKLDFMLYSDAVTSAKKSFVLRTESMSAARLSKYGFAKNNTESASDHYPVIADFLIAEKEMTSIERIGTKKNINIYPNPSSGNVNIECSPGTRIEIFNSVGQLEHSKICKLGENSIEIAGLKSGIHNVKVLDVNDLQVGSCKIVITDPK